MFQLTRMNAFVEGYAAEHFGECESKIHFWKHV